MPAVKNNVTSAIIYETDDEISTIQNFSIIKLCRASNANIKLFCPLIFMPIAVYHLSITK